MVCDSHESAGTDEAALMGLLDLAVLSTLRRTYYTPRSVSIPRFADLTITSQTNFEL